MAQHRSSENLMKVIGFLSFVLCVVIALGTVQSFSSVVLPALSLGRSGWYAFSFLSGMSMIVFPSMLPIVFALLPLAGKRMGRSALLAFSFGLGVVTVLSLYGALFALAGKTFFPLAHVTVDSLRNGVYFISGIFAYAFALGEIGLVRLHLSSYTGEPPLSIQKRHDLAKMFLLGLFLGNIGIGSPHPAMPLLLIESASSGNVIYGWMLFVIHALGRLFPLLLLLLAASVGNDSLGWLIKRKQRIEKVGAWFMLIVAAFILTLGLFSHAWFSNVGQHHMLEKIMGSIPATGQLLSEVQAPSDAVGMFGQPASWGNGFLVLLWVLPLFWHYRNERARVLRSPAKQIRKLEHDLHRVEEERRGLEAVLHISEGEQGRRVKELEHRMDGLMKQCAIIEEAMRYGAESGLRDASSQEYEEELLRLRRNWYATLTVLLVVVFVVSLPG